MKRIFVLLVTFVFLVGCNGMFEIRTNIPIWGNTFVLSNETPHPVALYIDGVCVILVRPEQEPGRWSTGFIGGGYSDPRMSILVIDKITGETFAPPNVSISGREKRSFSFVARINNGRLEVQYNYY